MWLVYDYEEGIVIVTDNREEAESIYENYKNELKNFINKEGEFTGDERVILARIEKDFYSDETQEKTAEGDYYWDWKEYQKV